MTDTIPTITPQELGSLIKNGKTLDMIDVRMPTEFRECHAEQARNVPLDSLDPKTLMGGRKSDPLYIICKSGNRSRIACDKIIAAGYNNVVNVEGGTESWALAGLPVVGGKKGKQVKKVMSLERQVRIAAGLFILAGAVLAWYVHPWFIAIPAFVGAGLIFSGVTDTCAMGMIISKMPWNQ